MNLGESMYVRELDARSLRYEPRSTGYVYIVCPFHDDKNPSLSISTVTGYFRCWGCGAHGRFARLLATIDGVSEEEAEQSIQDSFPALEAYHSVNRLQERTPTRTKPFSVASFCSLFPSAWESSDALRYLEARGIHSRSVDFFGLRWGDRGRYRNRLIVPIVDTEGKLVTYAARSIVLGAFPKTRKPRAARTTLFGLRNLLKATEHWPWLVVVEGEFDAMYLQQFGVPAVSAMGTAGLTDSQIELLVGHADSVVLSYDGDEAGKKGMFGRREEGGNRLTNEGDLYKIRVYMDATAVTLPLGKDPNDLTERQVATYYGKYTVGGGKAWQINR